MAAALAWAAACFWLATLAKDPPVVVVVLAMTAMLGGALAAGVVTFAALQKKRDLGLYRDASKGELLLVVRQGPSALMRYSFAVCEPSGAVLAHVSKNILTDLFRKRWECRAADGRLICVAQEDSVLRALLRRLVSRLVLLHFVIYRGDGDVRLGEFRREMTLRDRYVLDLGGDRGRTLDRRLALAIGLLLDTGEKR